MYAHNYAVLHVYRSWLAHEALPGRFRTYTCIYIYMCVCVCVCIYIYIYKCMCVYIYIYLYSNICIYIITPFFTFTGARQRSRLRGGFISICVYMYIYIQARVHPNIFICIHIYVCT